MTQFRRGKDTERERGRYQRHNREREGERERERKRESEREGEREREREHKPGQSVWLRLAGRGVSKCHRSGLSVVRLSIHLRMDRTRDSMFRLSRRRIFQIPTKRGIKLSEGSVSPQKRY